MVASAEASMPDRHAFKRQGVGHSRNLNLETDRDETAIREQHNNNILFNGLITASCPLSLRQRPRLPKYANSTGKYCAKIQDGIEIRPA